MIVIIDYAMGNVGSIKNMLKKVGSAAIVSSSRKDIQAADKLILPGVGSFDNGMQQLEEHGLVEVLNERVLECRIPILGICLGMQLLTRSSEEGTKAGLGWIDGDTIAFKIKKDNESKLKIPHMGWNMVTEIRDGSLMSKLSGENKYYFLHSYHVRCDSDEQVMARAQYGYNFVCAVQKANIIGVQFHPEKSHKYGMAFFRRYLDYELKQNIVKTDD